MIVIAIEAIAGAAIIQYWYGDAPVWLTSLILTILLTLTNIFSVKSFGEFEYWFSLIKVVSIILFLLIGFAFIFGFGGHHTVGLSNLTGNGVSFQMDSALFYSELSSSSFPSWEPRLWQ